MSLRNEFETWLKQNNRPGSGKANSYLTGIEDVQTIAEASAKFKIPSVFDMPDDSLLSLKDYIDSEARKESHEAGSGAFNNVPGLHGVSYWRDGFCSAAISKLLGYRAFVSLRTKEENVLSRFRAWLSLPERNHGRGYKPGTIDRYVDAIVNFDAALVHWGVDLKGRKLHEIVDVVEFTKVEQLIRSRPEFDGYNNNVENGNPKNLNGTGNGDPSAALTQFRLYLESGAEKIVETAAGEINFITSVQLFAEQRKKQKWCSDNTDGDGTRPRVGYVANAKLRATLPMTSTLGTDAQVVQWFKDYAYPDGKSWLDGIDTNGCAAFGGYIKYLVTGGAAVVRPAKFTRSLESAVKAIAKPASECFYNKDIHEVLKYLGLVGFDFKKDFDEDDYQDALHAQRVIKRRLRDMGEKQIVEWDAAANQAKPNDKDPDFLTVNEFLWFVKAHLNEIENEVVEKKMEPAKHIDLPNTEKNKKPVVNMEDSDDALLLRLRAALRTKPFAILAGHSGTGKSRMVRKLAYMTCNDETLRYVLDDNGNVKTDANNDSIPLKEPGNFCMIQVKPNWHDSCDLLGYYSELGKRYRASEFVKFICKAYAYPKTPFFVCLDEMNLAPVEQYFAEYLSAIESRKLQGDVMTTDELVPKTAYMIKGDSGTTAHYDWLGCETTEALSWLENYGLTIPRNLFVVGTVNMDESTNQFSRKVLDRAMTIEMTDADFDAFGKQPPELNFTNVPYMGEDAIADLLAGQVQATELSDGQKSNLNNLKSVLSSTSFAVAYRFANEYALYEEALKSTVALSVKPDEGSGGPQPLELSESEEVADEATAESAGATAESSAEAAAETSAATSAAAKKPAIPSAFDDMVLMKVLPRISGDEADVKRIFYEGATPDKQDPRPSINAPAENTLLKLLGPKKDTASVRKIKWILARGGSYLSFWP